jgi:DNA-binding IclR family transcriptional regulator
MPHSQPVQALERALDLIEAVVQSPEGLSLRQMGELAELKSSTAFNLARTMTDRGYLRKTASRPVVYFPGPKMYQLAANLPVTAEDSLASPLLNLVGEYATWRFIAA